METFLYNINVVSTFHSVQLFSWKLACVVRYACYSSALIQIGTEPLRNIRIFTFCPNCLYISLEVAMFTTHLCFFDENLPFNLQVQWIHWGWQSHWVFLNKCNMKSVTLKAKICSVRVPSLPICWLHKSLIQSAVLQYFVHLANTERICSHSFHSFQQHCHEQWYRRLRSCSGKLCQKLRTSQKKWGSN